MKFYVLLSTFTCVSLIVPTLADAEPPHIREDPVQQLAEASHADVTYQVVFQKGDQVLGSPTVSGQFGREVLIEIANTMRVTVVAGEPDEEGQSLASASMAIFEDDAWQPAKVMSMTATLSATPSFEYSVEGTSYRFVVMPRLIVPPAD
ncbi:hypothetical protein [Brevundimonas sp.]|uniref:hypothetical protein n=1 Tax=Brevundimonas sp. TaxID=1871086 RepID=UPI003AF81F62